MVVLGLTCCLLLPCAVTVRAASGVQSPAGKEFPCSSADWARAIESCLS
jgi:hypothetical protein